MLARKYFVSPKKTVLILYQDPDTLLEMLMEILAVVDKFPMDNCVVPFKPWI
jgi:hypothetical protein